MNRMEWNDYSTERLLNQFDQQHSGACVTVCVRMSPHICVIYEFLRLPLFVFIQPKTHISNPVICPPRDKDGIF